MDKVLTFLTTEDASAVLAMWNDMFLSPEIAEAVLQDTSVVGPLITKAFPLQPSWTTTRCAVATEKMTGVAMVCATAEEYNKTFLFSLALAAEVDPGGSFSLSDKQAECAFAMARLWKKARPGGERQAAGRGPGVPAGPGGGLSGDCTMFSQGDQNSEEDSEEEGAGAAPLAWEVQEASLPDDLAQVHQRFVSHGLQVQAKELLEQCPKWVGLKTKAETNNHQEDASRITDRNLKMAQQKVIGLLRIYPMLHASLQPDEEAQVLSQKYFTLMLELESWLLSKRKEASLPNSIVPNEPQLFSARCSSSENQSSWYANYIQHLTISTPPVLFSQPPRLVQAEIQAIPALQCVHWIKIWIWKRSYSL